MDSSSNKRPKTTPIADVQDNAEGIAHQMTTYFQTLVRNGFLREEALQLTIAYQSALFMASAAIQQKGS